MTLKIIATKHIPFDGVGGFEVKETKIVFAETNGIYDAFVQANKDEVVKLTKEVREAHTHIHADRDQVRADAVQVDKDKKTVDADKKIVAADKATVAADRKSVV